MMDNDLFPNADNYRPSTELTVTSVLSLFDTTKQERETFVKLLMDKLEYGEANPLKVHYQLKAIETIIDKLTDGKSELSKRYKEMLLLEAAKHPGKKFTFGNSEIEVKEYGVKYDWSACNDAELLKNMEVYEALGKSIKARQEMLKTLPASGLETRIGDEMVTLYPPNKTSTTGISLTLK